VRTLGSAGNSGTPTTAHLADLVVPTLASFSDIIVVSISEKPKNAWGLLGRNILNGGKFDYDGTNGEFTLFFP
jgi:hypothetical protein